MINKWNYPTTIFHGENSQNLVPSILLDNNITRPLIITDKHLANTDRLDNLKSILNSNNINYSIYSELVSDPCRDDVYKALDAVRTNNHNSIIIIGGGSTLDLGKATALIANTDYDLNRFIDGADNYINLDSKLILPTIAIPTTAGTGSEVGRVAVIIDDVSDTNSSTIKTKQFIFHPDLIPNWVILDPMLSQSMPAHLTAATGMDALTHAIEAFFVESYHPMADAIALQAIQLIANNLIIAYKNPDNIESRGHMLSAATMAATAFQKGLGVVHSLSHPIGAIYKIHHGLLNAVILPYSIEFNRSGVGDKVNIIEKNLNLVNLTLTDWVLKLREELNIPHSLNDISSLKIDLNNHAVVDIVVNQALLDPSTASNPVLLTYDNTKKLLIDCCNGNL